MRQFLLNFPLEMFLNWCGRRFYERSINIDIFSLLNSKFDNPLENPYFRWIGSATNTV